MHETDLLAGASARMVAGCEAYLADGSWSAAPIDLVASAAASDPDRVALVDRDGSLTYGELDRSVTAACESFERWGVEAARPVLLVVDNTMPSVIAVHAAMRAGALVLLAPVSAGAAHLADILARTRPLVALAPSSWIAADGTPPVPGGGWRTLDQLPSPVDAVGPRSSTSSSAEPSVVIFTSGTTSRPKGVVHSLDTLLVTTRNYIDAAGLTAADRLFLLAPLASITGVLQAVLTAPALSASIVLDDRWSAEGTLALVVESGVTFYGGPDLLLDRILDQAVASGAAKVPIRRAIVGGTMLDPRALARAERDFGIVMMRAYGSSEAPVSSAGTFGESQAVRLADDGAPLGGVEVRAGSRHAPGELCIRGPHLFLGYIDAEDDAAAFDGEWFCTGDVADLDGGRVRISGRIKDIVIRNGLNIPISEVEGHLAAVPGVRRCAGFARTDPVTTERLAMAVLVVDGAELDFDEVIEHLKAAGLAPWKLPEELVLWDTELPENATGKVVRSQLEPGSEGRPRLLAPRLRQP